MAVAEATHHSLTRREVCHSHQGGGGPRDVRRPTGHRSDLLRGERPGILAEPGPAAERPQPAALCGVGVTLWTPPRSATSRLRRASPRAPPGRRGRRGRKRGRRKLSKTSSSSWRRPCCSSATSSSSPRCTCWQCLSFSSSTTFGHPCCAAETGTWFFRCRELWLSRSCSPSTFVDIPFRSAEADPHGPGYSADHRDSPVAVRFPVVDAPCLQVDEVHFAVGRKAVLHGPDRPSAIC